MNPFFSKTALRKPRLLKKGGFLLFLIGFFLQNAAAQCTLACSQNLQISLDASGQTTITVALIAPTAAQLCPGNIDLTVFNPSGQPISSTVGCSWVNQLLNVKLVHTSTGNVGWGSFVLRDFMPPTLGCGADKFIFCSEPTDAASLGYPSVSDNCTAMSQANLSFTDVFTDLACGTMQNGIAVTARIDRTWQATDAQGNTGFCTQKIWLKRATLADVVFPLNRDGLEAPNLDCSQNPLDLSLTGQPTVAGRPIDNNGSCDLAVSHTDQQYAICGPVSKRTLRTWQVVDWCLNTFSLDVQVIKNVDNTAPTLVLPQNLTISTPSSDCKATVALPQPTASDDCSGTTVAASWAFGTGFGPFQNVPTGVHSVIFTATDGCGNSKSGSISVSVVDQSPPQALCKTNLQIALAANGSAMLAAAAFDESSFDNCSIASRLVSRDGGLNFLPQATFSCADVMPTPLLLKLKIVDAAGNSDVCEASIFVKDQSPPSISCPTDAALLCWQDFSNLNLTGNATATDNCGSPILTFSDLKNLSSCNVGSINRTWKATDLAGNTAVCTQKITISQAASTLAVSFPKDSTFASCAGPLTEAVAGRPIFSGNTCVAPTVSFTDTVFNAALPACFKIRRAWRVVEPCVFDPTTGSQAGLWLHVQNLTVADGSPPTLILPHDTIINTTGNCNALVQINLADATALDCSPFLNISNNGVFSSQKQQNASGKYPTGVHSVIFTATDGCGNSATAALKIEVKCTPPPTVAASGQLVTEGGLPIKNTQLTCQTDGFVKKTTTDSTGKFVADGLPSGATFILQPKNRTNWLAGLSTFDLLAIRKHILGVKLLDSPYKFIAADVNRSGTISTFDIVELRKLLLGVYDTLPKNDSWRFVDASYVFQDPTNPLAEPFLEKKTLTALSSNATDQNFIGVKIGDANGSVDPSAGFGGSSDDRDADGFWPIFLENKAMRAGFSYKIKLRAGELAELEGFQMALKFDEKKLRLGLTTFGTTAFGDENLNRRCSADGFLTMSWDGLAGFEPTDSTLCEFQFDCLETTDLSQALSLKTEPLRPEAYEKTGRLLEPILTFLPEKRGEFGLLPNRPNPFSEKTTIPFWLPVPTTATLTFSDLAGRVLKEISENLGQGYHEIELSAADLPPTAGVYFVRLSSPDTPPMTMRLLKI